jgi:N-acetylglucosamine kinase
MSARGIIAAGLDLGGTKIEAQVFGEGWALVERRRVDTPSGYDALLAALADQIGWVTDVGGPNLPVGVAAAGLINPTTGLALTANLSASGRPLPADLMRAAGRKITWVNDCRALVLSEAVLGAGRGHAMVVGIVLGTGIGGGVALNGQLLPAHSQAGGEFGHVTLNPALIAAHDLPILRCGCGRWACSETLVSGPGLVRIAKTMTGRDLTAPEVTAGKLDDPALAKVWEVWCALAADLLVTVILMLDPSVIVLGGGLSNVAELIPDLERALKSAVFAGFPLPALRLAEGGESSGARGAALAAWRGESMA